MALHTTTVGGDHSGSLLVFCHGLFGQGRNWTGVAKALADEHRSLLRRPAPPRPVAVARPGRLPRPRRPGRRGAARRRAGDAGRPLDGRQGRDGARAAAPRAGRAAGGRRRRAGRLRREHRVRGVRRGDAGSRPRPVHRRSDAEEALSAAVRRGPCATSCCRTCVATATPGAGRWTSRGWAPASHHQRVARRPAHRADLRRSGAVGRGCGVALRPARARRGHAVAVPPPPPADRQGRRALGALGEARGVRRGAATVHRPLRPPPEPTGRDEGPHTSRCAGPRRGRGASVVGAEPGHHVAQLRELGGDRVAATGQAVDLGLQRLQLALGVGVAAVAQRLGLLLGGVDDLLGLAARPADVLLGLEGGLLPRGLGGLGGLAGPLLRGVGRAPGRR